MANELAAGRQIVRSLGSLANTALAWWWGEIVALVPERFRRLLSAIGGRVVVFVSSGAVCDVFVEVQGRTHVLGRLDLSSAASSEPDGISAQIAEWREHVAGSCVRLAADRVLRAQGSLPIAAESNLRQVLTFEFDRLTPFRAEETYFSHRVLGRNQATRSISVELTFLPRAHIDPLLKRLGAMGISPETMEIEGKGDTARTLIPIGSSSEPRRRDRFALACLAGLAAMLALTAVAIPLHRAHAIAGELTQQVAEAKKKADEATRLRKELDALGQQNRSLLERKRGAPSVSEMILALTDALDDQTWLTELQINGSEVQMSGTTASASALVAHLDASRFFSNASFRSSVTQDAKTNREQFSVSTSAIQEARQ
jgi:general secretion pathway protein L